MAFSKLSFQKCEAQHLKIYWVAVCLHLPFFSQPQTLPSVFGSGRLCITFLLGQWAPCQGLSVGGAKGKPWGWMKRRDRLLSLCYLPVGSPLSGAVGFFGTTEPPSSLYAPIGGNCFLYSSCPLLSVLFWIIQPSNTWVTNSLGKSYHSFRFFFLIEPSNRP